MRMIDIIHKKRNNLPLTKEEIEFFIAEYVKGNIPDYQVSALLMAICCNELNSDEMFYLTNAMLHSGDIIDLSEISGVKVDKHSTGGVGDKTSLVVAPLAAVYGVKMAKMSGRGLGHTGGTLDKLESIPGFKIELTGEEFIKQVNEIGLAIIGQTANIAPADKKLYALRDVTGTIEAEGLIASSIMSKKLASGADHIVLDVKVGSGAFMKDKESALSLAKQMVRIGEAFNKETVATLTDMSQPLGCAIGNSLEVIEAIETLKGRGPKDFEELCIKLTAEILLIAKLAETEEEAEKMAMDAIKDGRGLEKLRQMIEYQHGDTRVIDDYSLFKQASDVIELVYEDEREVYVSEIDALTLGEASVLLGAGRATKEDEIDHSVGIILNKKIGDKLETGDVIAKLYGNGKNIDKAIDMINKAIIVEDRVIDRKQLIIAVVRKEGK